MTTNKLYATYAAKDSARREKPTKPGQPVKYGLGEAPMRVNHLSTPTAAEGFDSQGFPLTSARRSGGLAF